MTRVALIMAGGAGERFWPVSSSERPKQFLKLTQPEKSMLRESVERAASIVGAEHVFVSTTRSLLPAVESEIGLLPPDHLIAEPEKRNTAGALLWAFTYLENRFSTDLSLAVLTSDHYIDPPESFRETVENAFALAEATEGLVTIGIQPTRPETGYGYIKRGRPELGGFRVQEFREKPDAATAAEFLKEGSYYWNSGMFFWTVSAFRSALRLHAPPLCASYEAMLNALSSGNAERATEVFSQVESASIDKALLEKANSVYVTPALFTWDDLGTWDALTRSLPSDSRGNVGVGKVHQIDTDNTIVYTATPQTVHLLGAKDIVVVVTEDKVMICHRDRVQDVREFAAGEKREPTP